ncbi:MAG: hypothetical protein COV74_10860 [Candidatus Omnitrophica bacterium CG11_big_fil_rev_8_21_14_0_20_45_26]|uniref:Transposase n=1 Tax=Candidatus Abzuiibacterium crystallinum TaxID=1974748 RepID=A0A2H0LL00_9BACT|nr:MAG: hypothetical protein COV74_10860 [Candidatus Omnitrophica bacterium CG11_big_fil_rev_8_21_14_0_20_45_26]PIW63834.1 MAG: hypothetical protein COW12_07950 [Candidatus Omnitrophica bacterium CG12_big_fil_rev_8_21_14_0_65_45_16]
MKKQKKIKTIDPATHQLSPRQEQLIKTQIRKNSKVIDFLIERIDLLINREKCPKDANTLLMFRKRLNIAMAENDTFRHVLWLHQHHQFKWRTLPKDLPDPVTFLVNRIKTRQQTAIASLCMK